MSAGTESPIQLDCPECGRHYAIQQRHAGKTFPCKQCGKPVRVESSEPKPEESEVVDERTEEPLVATEPAFDADGHLAAMPSLPAAGTFAAEWPTYLGIWGMALGLAGLFLSISPIFSFMSSAPSAAGMALSIAAIVYIRLRRTAGLSVAIVGASAGLIGLIIWLIQVIRFVDAMSGLSRRFGS